MRYRKSINLGSGFRINFSKSGIGYSWGIKGYRITKTANGQTRETFSLPRTGLSHTRTLSNKQNVQDTPNQKSPLQQDGTNKFIVGAESNLSTTTQEELIKSITANSNKVSLNIFLVIGVILLSIFVNPAILILLLSCIPIYILDTERKTTFLEYTLEEDVQTHFSDFINMFQKSSLSQCLWVVNNSQYLHSIHDKKRNAGASNLVKRIPMHCPQIIKSGKLIKPFYVKASIDVIKLKINRTQLLFLPEIALIKNGRKILGVSYDNLNISSASTRFIEDGIVPKDGEIVDSTWRYVNKNGTPDKRFNNNRQLPILKYGVLILSSDGLYIEIQTSNNMVPSNIKTSFSNYCSYLDCLEISKR